MRIQSVFEQLGFPDHAEMERKSHIVAGMQQVMLAKGFDKSGVARMLGITEEQLESILKGRFREISEEQLSKYNAILEKY